MILDNVIINTRPLGPPFRPRLNINDSHLSSPREDHIARILRIQAHTIQLERGGP